MTFRIFKYPSRAEIECMICLPNRNALTGQMKTDILTGDSDGAVRLWRYESEKCANVYRPEASAKQPYPFIFCSLETVFYSSHQHFKLDSDPVQECLCFRKR